MDNIQDDGAGTGLDKIENNEVTTNETFLEMNDCAEKWATRSRSDSRARRCPRLKKIVVNLLRRRKNLVFFVFLELQRVPGYCWAQKGFVLRFFENAQRPQTNAENKSHMYRIEPHSSKLI